MCAIRFALANNVPQVYVCGQYSIRLADEFGTDVSAFKKIGAGRVLTVSGRSSDAADAVIQTSPNAASPKFRFFFVEDGGSLTLENLTLQGGRADFVTNSSGGAVFVESTQSGMGLPSSFEATNCNFNNNFARADGGAVRFEDGNRDPNEGAPLESRAFFRLTHCVFTGNIALQQGGGVATSDITIVEGCTFDGNRAGPLVGPATGLGGGFWAGPRAIGGGSGSAPVFLRSSTAPVTITSFTNNVAGEGGGLFCRGPGERQLTNVEFRGNQAQSPVSGSGGETGGGAVHAELSDRVTMFACIFGGANPGEPNFTTLADGGAILSESTNMEVVNSFFFNNMGFNSGGAARMTGSQRSLYRQCTFQSNSAPSGGAVYVDNNADVAFDDCIIRLNTATGVSGAGGGLFLGGGRPFVYNCTLTGNQAAAGSGVFNNGAGTAILHTTIADIRGNGKAVQFGPKPSDPVIIQNSIIGDTWSLPLTDQAFALPLPPQVVVRFTDVELVNIVAFNALPGYGGNINCNPLFANLAAGDVHLTQCSPCIDRAFEMESDNVFAGIIDANSQWHSLLSVFFQPCSQVGGHCRGDYDDNAATDDVAPTDGLSDRDGNPLITDSPAISQTMRRSECQSDMGADESTTSITAELSISCQTRGVGNPNSNDCGNVGTLVSNPTCSYCVGDDVFLVPNLNSTCPGEFVVTWYRRNPNIPNPCPPTAIPAPGDVQLPSASFPNISVLADGKLCINDATLSNTGCYYAVATRQSCGDTQPPPPEFELFGVCASQVAACTCITIGTPPSITSQPQPSTVCDGTPTSISVTAVGSGGPLCYQWFRRDTACTGPGFGGTAIPNSNSPTLSFLPARARCPGEPPSAQDDNGYYYVVITYCSGGSGECSTVTSDCARLTVYCPPAITGGGSAIVCGGGAAGGIQDCCYTIAAPSGCVPVVTWYKDLGAQGSEADDIIVSTGSPAGVTIVTVPLGNDLFQTCIVWDLSGLSQAQAAALAGNYYMKAYCADPNCTTRSANCSLTVRPQPEISVNPQDAAVCEGSPQCLSATVSYTGVTGLCWEWRAKPACSDAGDGVLVASGTWSPGQPLVFEHCIDSAQVSDELCYFFRIRVCTPDDLEKCPWVASGCGCLDVRPQLIACELPCDSGVTDAAGNCLFCPGSTILLCCEVSAADGPICYQWQRQTVPQIGAWEDIPGQTAACLEIRSFDPATDATCYRVRVNYADLSGPNCPETSDKCDAVYSNALCIAPTEECCEIECPCKDNSAGVQEVYSVWHTGEWDGVNGEWSFDRTTTDGAVIKAIDDFYLCPSAMHRITTFTGKMLVKQSNPSLELNAKLRFYEDCNGKPGELIEEFDSECAAFIEAAPEGFNLYQFQFFFDCLWLKGGAYWVSLVAVAPVFDSEFEAFWATAGVPGDPPQATVLGMRPLTMDGNGPWTEFDPCCHPCSDLQFCLIGESCPIIWDNGKPGLGGADDPQPANPPFLVSGTRSEKSTLVPRNSRAADQFVIKTCAPEEVCYLEGYIFTNCLSFEAHLEIYENDCREPDFTLPGGVPYFHRIADQVVDLEYDNLRVGSTAVRAYRVSFCDWPEPLIFEPGKNYWISISVRDTFSAAERAYFAHVRPPCDPCTSGNVWKIDPGAELAPGRQITDWQSAGADFAFLIATKKQAETDPLGTPPGGGTPECMADANQDGVTDVADIFEFLSVWFAGCP